MATERATHGFWKGILSGLVVAAAGLLALAWLYPPRPLLPPEIDPGALEAPAAPGQPQGAAEPEAPRSEALLAPVPAKPIIEDVPAPDVAPATAGPAGTPSLVPGSRP